jgi:hypothetical protein
MREIEIITVMEIETTVMIMAAGNSVIAIVPLGFSIRTY